jgi:hypothetical protein
VKRVSFEVCKKGKLSTKDKGDRFFPYQEQRKLGKFDDEI